MSTIFKVIIIIAILLGLVLVGTMISEKIGGGASPSPSPSTDGQLPVNTSVEEEKEIKDLAENFLIVYGSYQKGNFDSLKNAQRFMTKKFQEDSDQIIKQNEKKPDNVKTIEHINFVSIPKETIIISFDSNKALIAIKFDFSTLYGAYLYGENGALMTVDQEGKITFEALKNDVIKKQATISINKEDNAWKIDSIKIEKIWE